MSHADPYAAEPEVRSTSGGSPGCTSAGEYSDGQRAPTGEAAAAPGLLRDGVLADYNHRCAISNLPDDHLLDAAHIMADAHELLGQPVLPNGIALSKIHHAAFDSHLIGIDPDRRVHVSERLLALHDGPLLEHSLKAIAGTQIRPPRRQEDHPDRDRLAARFEQFKRVA